MPLTMRRLPVHRVLISNCSGSNCDVSVSTRLCFRMEYLFNFDDTFEIHDDIEVLKRMGLALGE